MKVNRDEIKHDITAVREESTTKMKTLEAGWYTTHRLMKVNTISQLLERRVLQR